MAFEITANIQEVSKNGASVPSPLRFSALREEEVLWIQEELKSRVAVRPVLSLHKYFARRSGRVFNWIIGEIEKFFPEKRLNILDPMGGGGTILWEAFSRGHSIYGKDLNPLASLIQTGMFLPGDEHLLAQEINRLFEDCDKILQPLWKTKVGNKEADIVYTHFVKEVNCPCCGEKTRLFNNTFLNFGRTRGKPCDEKNPADHWCPPCGHINLTHEFADVECENCQSVYSPESGTVNRGEAVCESCQSSFKTKDALQQGSALRMVAIEYVDPKTGAKLFKKPDDADVEKFFHPAVQGFDKIELGEIPEGWETQRLISNGFRKWEDLFTPRQLLAYQVLFDRASKIEDSFSRLMCLLAISSTLEYNCALVAYNFKYRKSHHLFTHHAFPVPMQGVEGNLPGIGRKGAGTPRNRLYEVLKIVKSRKIGEKGIRKKLNDFDFILNEPVAGKRFAMIKNGDSTRLDLPDGCMHAVVTDPPYHDNVQYGELTEFFLVWLRKYLDGAYFKMPCFNGVQDKEATSNVKRDGEEDKRFEGVLTQIFSEAHRVTMDNGVMAFSFHDTDPKGWDSLALALKNSGWFVHDFIASKSEFQGNIHLKDYKDPLDEDLIVLCSKTELRENDFSHLDDSVIHTWGKELAKKVNQGGLTRQPVQNGKKHL